MLNFLGGMYQRPYKPKTCQWNFYAGIALTNLYVILVRHLVSDVKLFLDIYVIMIYGRTLSMTIETIFLFISDFRFVEK